MHMRPRPLHPRFEMAPVLGRHGAERLMRTRSNYTSPLPQQYLAHDPQALKSLRCPRLNQYQHLLSPLPHPQSRGRHGGKRQFCQQIRSHHKISPHIGRQGNFRTAQNLRRLQRDKSRSHIQIRSKCCKTRILFALCDGVKTRPLGTRRPTRRTRPCSDIKQGTRRKLRPSLRQSRLHAPVCGKSRWHTRNHISRKIKPARRFSRAISPA